MNSIAYIIPTLDRIGGAERQVQLLAEGFAKKRWRVDVIALSGNGGEASAQLEASGVAFHSLHMRKGLADPRGWVRLHSYLATRHPEIVHSHLPHATLMARLSRLFSPARVLVDTLHSPATGGVARKLGYQSSTPLVDKVTAVSHATAQAWLTAGLIPKTRLSVIPNGIDTSYWKRNGAIRCSIRNKLGLAEEFLWIAVGRLDAVKDHATLLRAFALIKDGSKLLIAGSGPLKETLVSLASDLGLSNRVIFTGFAHDVRQWVQAADGFVLCSLWEGLPMALLEAASCEVPAVITDVPGSREVLPLSLQSVVPVQDPPALAATMSTILRLPESERRNIGNRMRAAVSAWFGLDAVLARWEDLYGSLLEDNPQPSRIATGARASGRTLQVQ